MYKLLRIALVIAPLASGAAWAQGSGTSGSAGAPGTLTPPLGDDTRTPLQQKAQQLDEATRPLPGDATTPTNIPNTVPRSDRAGMPDNSGSKKIHRRRPDEREIPRRTDAEHDTKIDKGDLGHDQLNSDK
jgi:hypothetical protein